MKEKIERLFDEYEEFFEGRDEAFRDSQMIKVDVEKRWQEKPTFFPCGYGNYSGSKNLKSSRIMILGNDWGMSDDFESNKDYLSTINPLLKKLNLVLEETFFTNFYMGLRNSNKYSFSQTDDINHSKEFKELCFCFFEKQLEVIKPKIVLCLGTKVKDVLSEKLKMPEIEKASFEELFKKYPEGLDVNQTRFVFIPHASYSHISWKKLGVEKINNALR